MSNSIRRGLSTLLSLCLSTALLSACGGGGTSTQNSLPQSPSQSHANVGVHPGVHWQVNVGADRRDHALQTLDFFASTITIDAGDSVTWKAQASEHTVSFLLPNQSPFTAPLGPAGGDTVDGTAFTSSGVIVAGQTYTLKFPKPGKYVYYCLLHPPEMTGTIVVQAAGTPYPHPQGYYTGKGNQTANAELSAAQKSVKLFPYTNGGATVVAGISPGLTGLPPSHSTVYRFLNADNLIATTIDVTVGTTVTWVNQTNNEPHTVTFPVVGQPLPPNIDDNPFSPPTGGSTYDGSQVTNSGVLGSAIGFPTNQYSLTFTKAGTYTYECLFHDDFGMVGTVKVHPN